MKTTAEIIREKAKMYEGGPVKVTLLLVASALEEAKDLEAQEQKLRLDSLKFTFDKSVEKSDSGVYGHLPEPLRSVAREAHGALHVVWTKNAHQGGYVKDEWKALSAAIDKLVRMAAEK